MAFGLLEKTKKKLVGELLKFENKHPKICIEDYGVATRGAILYLIFEGR